MNRTQTHSYSLAQHGAGHCWPGEEVERGKGGGEVGAPLCLIYGQSISNGEILEDNHKHY